MGIFMALTQHIHAGSHQTSKHVSVEQHPFSPGCVSFRHRSSERLRAKPHFHRANPTLLNRSWMSLVSSDSHGFDYSGRSTQCSGVFPKSQTRKPARKKEKVRRNKGNTASSLSPKKTVVRRSRQEQMKRFELRLRPQRPRLSSETKTFQREPSSSKLETNHEPETRGKEKQRSAQETR